MESIMSMQEEMDQNNLATFAIKTQTTSNISANSAIQQLTQNEREKKDGQRVRSNMAFLGGGPNHQRLIPEWLQLPPLQPMVVVYGRIVNCSDIEHIIIMMVHKHELSQEVNHSTRSVQLRNAYDDHAGTQ